ncbi:thiamine diphosphokinase [Halolactibacillus alkaliphilus]|uniref:Thiamine diphosphokinase n=1 Tax=Halolactibacillus alkaliphilus TaxID=442899 RepID=A0A511WYS1_9BACI|nr:thiamine diphosphokinase [Halolactibacillus alkaliphilus]GEN55738.1 thiamine pyrophosphokinase [Halolactibacillus alkaliphilus]SFO64191.1 thiamine diphosphokinase [Halolactibacillus alkaliphilus]
MTIYGIVAGGPEVLLPDLTQETIDIWIGCDRGCHYILKAHLALDLAIGDFDSVSEDILEEIKQEAKSVIVYPSDKDDSDLELAIKAVDLKAGDQMVFYGVTGGRLDHAWVNVGLLKRLAMQGFQVKMVDAHHKVSFYLPGHYTLYRQSEDYLSLLPLTAKVTGVSLTGFKYPLKHAVLTEGSSLSLSNQLIEPYGSISFQSGILMVISAKEL